MGGGWVDEWIEEWILLISYILADAAVLSYIVHAICFIDK